jgi:hypothetical protein
MIRLIRTNSINNDFIELVRSLDNLLAILDGDEYAFYAKLNKQIHYNMLLLLMKMINQQVVERSGSMSLAQWK